MNALYDRAFETGLITISPDFRVKISSILKSQSKSETIREYFLEYENKPIILPSKFIPDIEFIEYHNKERFEP